MGLVETTKYHLIRDRYHAALFLLQTVVGKTNTPKNSCIQDIVCCKKISFYAKLYGNTMLKIVISFVFGVILSSAIHEVLYSIDGQSMLDLLKQATSSLFGEMISLKDALLG